MAVTPKKLRTSGLPPLKVASPFPNPPHQAGLPPAGLPPVCPGEAEPASPLARLWQQRLREEDQDFVIHIMCAVGPNTNTGAGPGQGGGFDVPAFKRLMEEHVCHLPRFSSVLVKRKTWYREAMAWVPTVVDVHQHVLEVDLRGTTYVSADSGQANGVWGAGGAPEVSRDCVMRYVEEVAAAPLRSDIPLWEMQVLTHPPIPIPSSSSSLPSSTPFYTQTILFRIHHSIADGIALASLLMKVTTTSDGHPSKVWTSLPERYTRRRSPLQLALWYLSYAANSVGALGKLLLLLLLRGDPVGGVKPQGTDIRHERREVVRFSVPLQPVKELAKAAGSTVNDVMLCLIAAATHWHRKGLLSSLLGGSPAVHQGQAALPRLPRALFMANIRSPSELKRKGGAGSGPLTSQVPLGTRIGFFSADLPDTAVPLALLKWPERLQSGLGVDAAGEEDSMALSRSGQKEGLLTGMSLLGSLWRLSSQTAHIKHSFEAWFVNKFLVLICYLFGPMATWHVVLHVIGKVTVALSNVPGPPQHLFFAGSEILAVDQFLAGGPLGVTVHTVSYESVMHMTITSHPATVDAKQFGQLMILAWDQLQKEQKEKEVTQD